MLVRWYCLYCLYHIYCNLGDVFLTLLSENLRVICNWLYCTYSLWGDRLFVSCMLLQIQIALYSSSWPGISYAYLSARWLAMDWMTRILFLGGKVYLSSPSCSDHLWGTFNLLSNEYWQSDWCMELVIGLSYIWSCLVLEFISVF